MNGKFKLRGELIGFQIIKKKNLPFFKFFLKLF